MNAATAPKRWKPRFRVQAGSQRSYLGIDPSLRYADFMRSELSADGELLTALSGLRARSRYLCRNDPYAVRFLQLLDQNVVGSGGFRLKSKAAFASGELDVLGNKIVEAAWNKWSKKASACGLMSMRALTALGVMTEARDGEFFAEVRRSNRFPDKIAFRPFEADLVDEGLNQINPNSGNQIRMGVEVNRDRRPVAYHILDHHPGDYQWTAPTGRRYRRIPAERVIHVFRKLRAGQTRGEPRMASVMLNLQMLNGYRDAELTARRIAAGKMGFFETEAGQNSDIDALADEVDQSSGELIHDVEPGRLTALPPGMKFQSFDPHDPGTDYADYERQIIRSVSSGLGPAYHSMAQDPTQASFSSMRTATLDERDFYRSVQSMWMEQWALPVAHVWLDSAMEFGGMALPIEKFDKFSERLEFLPRGWSWVDPKSEMDANVKGTSANLVSLTKIAAQHGQDVDEFIEELKSDRDKIKSVGLSYGDLQSKSENETQLGEDDG